MVEGKYREHRIGFYSDKSPIEILFSLFEHEQYKGPILTINGGKYPVKDFSVVKNKTLSGFSIVGVGFYYQNMFSIDNETNKALMNLKGIKERHPKSYKDLIELLANIGTLREYHERDKEKTDRDLLEKYGLKMEDIEEKYKSLTINNPIISLTSLPKDDAVVLDGIVVALYESHGKIGLKLLPVTTLEESTILKEGRRAVITGGYVDPPDGKRIQRKLKL